MEPPPEPLPARWNLDDIWSTGNNPTPAPDDVTRLHRVIKDVPYYALLGKTAAFPVLPSVRLVIEDVTTINPANYDGTFLPSSSVRTVTPPDEAAGLNAIGKDRDLTVWPWSTPIVSAPAEPPASTSNALLADEGNALASDIGSRILIE